MEDERNVLCSPDPFQDLVLDASFVCTVVPLGKITVTVRIIGRRPNLDIVYTSIALESERSNQDYKTALEGFMTKVLKIIAHYIILSMN